MIASTFSSSSLLSVMSGRGLGCLNSGSGRSGKRSDAWSCSAWAEFTVAKQYHANRPPPPPRSKTRAAASARPLRRLGAGSATDRMSGSGSAGASGPWPAQRGATPASASAVDFAGIVAWADPLMAKRQRGHFTTLPAGIGLSERNTARHWGHVSLLAMANILHGALAQGERLNFISGPQSFFARNSPG